MTNSDAFRKMADRIDKNEDADFCGAFVIIPPQIEGIDGNAEVLLLNNKKDYAAFWSLVRGKAEIAMAEHQFAERSGNQWPNARR